MSHAFAIVCLVGFLPIYLQASPMIPGLIGKHPLDERLTGEILLGELRCTACHEDKSSWAWARKSVPDLPEIGSRVSPDYLRRFLASPADAHLGVKMPDLMTGLSPSKRSESAEALASFLINQAKKPFSTKSQKTGNAATGRKLFHEVGCVACHPARSEKGEETAVNGLLSLAHVPAKYRETSLASFLFNPLHARPSGRMPDLHLTRAEAKDLAAFLMGFVPNPSKDNSAWKPKAGMVALGQKYFREMNCAACHSSQNDPKGKNSLPLSELNPNRGCLSERPSGTPDFNLNAGQRKALVKALTSRRGRDSFNPSSKEKIALTLTALNCIACHERDDYGGPSENLRPHLQTTQEELGKHARIPPELTLTGAKLRQRWMNRVLFDGERSRPYQILRMPNFGEDNLSFLPNLFAEVDTHLAGEFPDPERKKRGFVRSAGHKLVGDKGLNCIACHIFNRKPSPGFQGMDLLTSYDRLRPSWFYNFMKNPAKYRPGIVMPNYWTGDEGTHLDILDGNASAQIWAIWHYFSYGQGAPTPPGIHNPGSNLEVGKVTRTYRGRSRIAGYRGIAVGFPGGLNYAFNAETGTLSGLWKGDFISVGWGGQGAGSFNPRSRAISLAQDLSFHALPNSDAPWPLLPMMNKENPVNPDPLYPKNLGYQFLGYSLDEDFVPTFSYRIGDVTIEDKSTSVIKEGQAMLNRMLSISSDEPRTVHFRALVGKVEKVSETSYKTPDLSLSVNANKATPNDLRPLGTDKSSFELLLNLFLPKGKSQLRLDYDLLR